MIYFLDTSALAKRYLAERGSNRIRRLLERKDDIFYQPFLRLLNLHRPYIADSGPKKSRRAELSFLLRAYVAHSHEDYLLLPYSDALIDRASALIARHVLRALDALQLASALELRDSLPAEAHSLTFLSADDRLLDAARDRASPS